MDDDVMMLDDDHGHFHSDDSGVATDYHSDMESIISGDNYAYRWDSNRRFHGIITNVYNLPNDDHEIDRLDKLHFVMKSILRSNIIVPVPPNPTMMLDVGTGPGHWVIEVADKYGSANVIGIDLSPIQPEDVPPNAEFRVADLTEDMYMFHDNSMDLVHSRMIKAGVLEHQWDPYIREVFRILKPGTGYAQFIETGLAVWDGNDVPEGSPFQLYCQFATEYFLGIGVVLGGKHLEDRFRRAGFVDIKRVTYKIYLGNWRGDRGRMGRVWNAAKDVWGELLRPVTMTTFKDKFPDREEREKFALSVVQDYQEHSYHAYALMDVVTARKPLPDVPFTFPQSRMETRFGDQS